MIDFDIKQGSQEPALQLRALQATGAVIDLTGASATFSMRDRQTRVVKIDATACVITNEAAGELEYRWTVTDTNTPGVYDADVAIILGSGKLLILPSGGYLQIRVVPAI